VVADGRPATVIIAGDKFGYPNGLGATARVAAYAQGMAASDACVHVVSLATPGPSCADGGNSAASGVANGVSFEYACGTRVRGQSFLRRRLIKARVPVRLASIVRARLAQAPNPKAILVYTDSPFWIAAMALLAHRHGAKCLVDVCELPFVNERGWARLAVRRWLQDNVAYRLADGFIVISAFLDEYVARHAGHRAPRLRVPIMVNSRSAETEVPTQRRSPLRQVAYVGSLGHPGEMADLIAAFAKVTRDHPDATLRIIGAGRPGYRAELLSMADGMGLGGRVELVGVVGRGQLPAMLADAAVLVLPRRDGLFSRAGFPTKLADYLATGRPVVVTSTGEIPRYLEHGVTAYLSPPGDLAAFADQMRHVLDNPAEAHDVGLAGREVAKREFDARLHGSRVIDFLRGL
jgi:glycosyltransferase involved in cell wall biosynthesis